MTKKSFNTSLTDIFAPTEIKPESIPQQDVITEENLVRTTLILNSNTYETIKSIAYWERKLIKDVIEDGLRQVISRYSMDEIQTIIEKFKNQ